MGPISRHFGLLVASFFLIQGFSSLENYKPDCDGRTNCFKRCPKNWMFYENNCYGFYSENVPWVEAESLCFKYGSGHLSSILDQKEMDAVATFIASKNVNSDHVWIGLYDPRETRRWKWSDLSLLSFQPWENGEPNNKGNNEFCVHLSARTGYKRLNDADCSLEKSFLCKQEL